MNSLLGKYSNLIFLVSPEDQEHISGFKWHHTNGYAARYIRRSGKKSSMPMHHEIMGIPKSGFVVDHINGNALDNRRNNLRIVSIRENVINQSLHKNNTSGFKGVSKFDSRWRAYITPNRKQISLGIHKTKEEAARAYNKAALEIYGAFAKLNIL